MTVAERNLKVWRRQSLIEAEELLGWDSGVEATKTRKLLNERILILTQELLDAHLIRSAGKAKDVKAIKELKTDRITFVTHASISELPPGTYGVEILTVDKDNARIQVTLEIV